jgi:dCTP deaminase
MILSDNDIRAALKSGSLRIEPLDDSQIGPASVDMTLSNEFWRFRRGLGTVDLENGHNHVAEPFTAEKITLAPGEMLLGKTVERITLSPDVAARIEGRSTFARMGVAMHVTSGFIQPGSDNHQVLEMVNFAPFSIVLRPGMRVCQVIFERLESATGKPYAKYGKIAVRQ